MPNGLPGPLRLTTLFLLAFAAAQQQQSRKDGSQSSPPENAALRQLTQTNPHSNVDRQIHKNGKYTSSISDDERAVATLAPAGLRPAVRAPPARSAAGSSAGLAQPLRARKLQDWEVENFVLLATVDGSIYARDRNTGKELWKFYSEDPMVQTKYNRNPSSNQDGEDTNDDFMWIVEPNDGGSLYAFIPGPDAGIQKLPMTVRQLAEVLSPYTSEDSPFVYTAEKRTTLFTLNATNGAALKYFGVGGAGVMDNKSCRKITNIAVDDDEDECEPTPTLHLGRTEYTVGIQHRNTGENLCTIKYFEWTPNKRDGDLAEKYLSTMDNKYIYSRFDGSIIALEHQSDDKHHPLPLYQKKFTSSPVVRVFDVVRPQGADARDTPLVILPQPIAPVVIGERAENVFINCTETGSWYAMSEMSYPSVTDGASDAKCYQPKGLLDDSAFLNGQVKASELVGVHVLSDTRARRHSMPTIEGPETLLSGRQEEDSVHLTNETIEYIQRASSKSVPDWRTWFNGFFLLPSLITLFVWVWFYHSKQKQGGVLNVGNLIDVTKPIPVLQPPAEGNPAEPVVVLQEAVGAAEPRRVHFAPLEDQPEVQNDTAEAIPGEEQVVEPAVAELEAPESPEQPKKKKAHRGSRGRGKKKRESQRKSEEEDVDDDVARIVEGVVGHQQPMQPDQDPTIEGSITDISDTMQINSIKVNNEKILGYGSGGTVVYEGTFEGREVAVKRMLLQYYDLASQEISLLSQSDDHPNVVRYYRHEKDRNFLYIAVERCQASLYDLYKEGGCRDLLEEDQVKVVDEISTNMKAALFQLAAGLHHLHSLRIIHRDIKPQNILVAYPKKNQKGGPRFVISDFGLCRTLPDNVSTLAGTMGNAGTIGWKAPELIGQPRPGEGRQSSTTNDSTSSNEVASQGVKRAVDIFSLGCVFFYVLTNGAHPFDREDSELGHVERELNIKRNISNFTMLQQWAEDAEEPMQLIKWMLSPKPEDRPTAQQVMNHPFFWSEAKRLNFLCDVSDHWEREIRDPPSIDLQVLEDIGYARNVHKGNFLGRLDKMFIDTLGKQRKYTGDRMLDLLRALRNKKNHYADMDEIVKKKVGELPAGYLKYWTNRFPNLLMACYDAVRECRLEEDARFKPYLDAGNVL